MPLLLCSGPACAMLRTALVLRMRRTGLVLRVIGGVAFASSRVFSDRKKSHSSERRSVLFYGQSSQVSCLHPVSPPRLGMQQHPVWGYLLYFATRKNYVHTWCTRVYACVRVRVELRTAPRPSAVTTVVGKMKTGYPAPYTVIPASVYNE